jgi:aspartyl-tRNA(Asn)/glutamyl-tRNA(Gln) amidotransferase subunit C
MALSADQVQWVAQLARLHLNPHDQQTFPQQLSAILDYVDQLREVNTQDVEPLAHPLDVQNVFRPDEQAPSLLARDALANAPQSQDDFFVVPGVFDAPQS